MGEIIINNSFSQLLSFSDSNVQDVKTALTYKDEAVVKEKSALYMAIHKAIRYRKHRFVAILKKRLEDLPPETICWLDENNKFPTGLLHLVKASIKNSYKIIDKRKKPESYHTFRWNNKPHPLRYYQQEALERGIDKCRGVFEMSVGSGKSELAIYLIKELGMNTLFIVPSSALQTQIYDRFELCFGKKMVQKITTKDLKSNKKLKPIRVVTIQTLASLQKQELLNILLPDVDVLFMDECHHAGANSFTDLLDELGNVYYRFGLSGTYMRNDSKTLDLFGVAGEKIYEFGAKRATEEGFLTPVQFVVKKLKGRALPAYNDEYTENYSSLEFLTSVKDIINSLPRDAQILLLVDRKDSCGNLLHEFLKVHGIVNNYVNGDDDKDTIRSAIEDFNDKKDRILIGSTIFSEGCDIRSTDVLLLCRGGKSEIAITQAIGRAVRLNPGKTNAIVYDFNFEYSNYLKKHLIIRTGIYDKQFGGTISYE